MYERDEELTKRVIKWLRIARSFDKEMELLPLLKDIKFQIQQRDIAIATHFADQYGYPKEELIKELEYVK